MTGYRIILIISVLGLLAGCSRGVAWLDRQDLEQPLLERAAERAEKGDIDAAIRLYQKALDEHPEAARAHLDVALLMHDYSKDYVGAIYHYGRYLERRPETDKRAMIEERIRLARQLFAAEVLSVGNRSDRLMALEQDNQTLRKQVEDLNARIVDRGESRGEPTPRARTQTAATRQPPRDAVRRAAAVSTYRVKRGDTLTSIAAELYGDGYRWREIQSANIDILGNSDQVKAGQILAIP